ncbi:MAG TPA: hypothetical protein P5168_05620, partial [Candidatus Methanomethylicus sp.]|nr:hypothetical protein [Candidatus Methanomethylicus sp.]
MSGSPESGNARRETQREWESRRAKFLSGKRCEWCGAVGGRVVTARTPLPPYLSQLREAAAKMLRERIDAGEYSELMQELEQCPQCGSTSLARRKQKRPALKC